MLFKVSINRINKQLSLNANGYDYTSGSILGFPWICFYSVCDWLHTWLVMKSSKLLRVSLRIGSLNPNWNRFGLFVDRVLWGNREYLSGVFELHYWLYHFLSFICFTVFQQAVILKLLNRYYTIWIDSRLSALQRAL